MPVEQMQLRDGAAVWNERASIGKAVVSGRERVPGAQVAPVLLDIEG